jgi:hypothetical protein
MARSQQASSTLDAVIVDPGSTGLKPGEKKDLGQVATGTPRPRGPQQAFPTPNPYPPVRISGHGIPDPTATPAQPAPVAIATEVRKAEVPAEVPEKGLGERISETFAVARDRLLEFIEQAKQVALTRTAEQEAQKARLREDEAKLAAEKSSAAPEKSPASTSAPMTGLRNWNAGQQPPSHSADGSTSVAPEAAPIRRPGMGRTSTATRTTEPEVHTDTRQTMSQRMTSPDPAQAPSSTRTRSNDPEPQR